MLNVPITALGLSHHLASADDLAVLAQAADAVTGGLAERAELSGFVLLPTCNRFELYIDGPTFHGAVEAALGVVRASLPENRAHLVGQFEVHAGQFAVQHLLEVAAGLDAMVVGEDEILGQVREALGAEDARPTPALRRLFHAALTTGKAVTAQTDLGSAGRSIAAVGLDLVERRHFPLAGRRALLVGTGAYARVVVAALQRLDCTDVAVYSRTGRADRFAETHPVVPVPADGLAAAIAAADLVVTCSGRDDGHDPELTAALSSAAPPGAAGGLPVLDLSLSGDVDPDAMRQSGIDLINLDEIGAHAPSEHAAAVAEARDLVSRGVETYLHLESGRIATPAVTAIRSHISHFIEREIESASRRYDPQTAEAVARSLHRVSNALLHTPSLRAAELARAGGLEDYQHALHTLFGIDVEAGA